MGLMGYLEWDIWNGIFGMGYCTPLELSKIANIIEILVSTFENLSA